MSDELRTLELMVRRAFEAYSPENYRNLFEALSQKKIFFPIDSTGQFALLVPVEGANRAVPFFLSDKDLRLGVNHGSITWEEALNMINNMPEADGLIINNSDSCWIAIDKTATAALAEAFPTPPPNGHPA